MTRGLWRAVCRVAIFASAVTLTMAQTDAPSVDDILNHYIRALGGKAAIQKLTSRVAKGTIAIASEGIEGTVQSWLQYPDKLLVVTDFPGTGSVRQGFDGTLGWLEDPQSTLRVIGGAELDDLRRTAIMDRAIRMKDVYPGLAFKDRETVDGKDVWVLETTIAPWTYRMYFDVNGGLMTRVEMDRDFDGGKKVTTVLVPSDFRPVGGVMVPFTISESSPSVSWVEKFSEITPNEVIDPVIFARPSQTTSQR